MTRRRKKPHKKVTLPDNWLRNNLEVKQYKESLEQACKVTGSSLNLVLDHTHCNGIGDDGKVRGLLTSEVNMLEGRFLGLFKKMRIEEKYSCTFPEFLIKLGHYLEEDNSDNPYHYAYMAEVRKKINRLTKESLESKILEDFKIKVSGLDKKTLVQKYMELWIESLV